MNRLFTQIKLALTGCSLLISGFYSSSAQTCEALVWSDEFNSNGVPNPDNWSPEILPAGKFNDEKQSYTSSSENSRVENGNLVIEAHKTGSAWTSGRLISRGKKSFLYGRIEFKAKLPSGIGTWPALWMLGESESVIGWPACGEIDVMEHVGWDAGKIHGSLHTPSSNGATVNTGTQIISNHDTEFHIYAADWDKDKIVFSVDGISYYTYNPGTRNPDTWPFYDKADYSQAFNDKFYIIMNVAMGGTFGRDIDPSLDLARMEVDYVRVYQNIDEIEIEGEKLVQSNQSNLKYRAPLVEGATYKWALPAGAEAVSGEDTNEIVVNWGSSDGQISVEVAASCTTFTDTFDVSTLVSPEGDFFFLDDFNDNNFQRWEAPESPNTFSYTERNNELRIDYDVTTPSTLPFATFNFPGVTDMTAYSQLNIRLKTFNESGSVVVRADLFDAEGISTTTSPVFRFEPLIDDGEYFTYSFDFNNNWGSSNSIEDVNAEKIAGLELFINYGAFGIVGKDSVWLESIAVIKPSAGPSVPKRPSHLLGILKGSSVELTWQDNSNDETGFTLYRSTEKTGDYQLVKGDIAAGITDYIDNSITSGTDYFYKILSINSFGESEFSNISIPVERVVASLLKELITENVSVYPNPAKSKVTIHFNHSFGSLASIKLELYNYLGQSIISKDVIENRELTLDLTGLHSGIYFIKIFNKDQIITKKLIK
ncbi:MAG: beta-glucanase (GH16 family) [Cyclobacteriaceae bacterium]|jgi:beta-glucanase (GH16 family)